MRTIPYIMHPYDECCICSHVLMSFCYSSSNAIKSKTAHHPLLSKSIVLWNNYVVDRDSCSDLSDMTVLCEAIAAVGQARARLERQLESKRAPPPIEYALQLCAPLLSARNVHHSYCLLTTIAIAGFVATASRSTGE